VSKEKGIPEEEPKEALRITSFFGWVFASSLSFVLITMYERF
jgi:hypothetical protein